MPRFQVTPWRHQADLLLLRDRLYLAGPDERQAAVNLISAWKRRAPLPHALDSTAQLVDATLHDDPQSASLLAIRNAYCAAFNRFVTGFCDTVQNSFKKMSMYDMAAELDMPGTFVELRHEATHEDLPSLRRLQMATEQALQWLWHHYWSKLDASLHPSPENRDQAAAEHPASLLRASLHRILRSFVSARREEIRKEGPKSGKDCRSSGIAMEHIVALGSTKRPAPLRHQLISLLLDDRMMVPSDARVGDALDGAYLIWDTLLCRLNAELQCFESFVELMFQHMVQPSKADAKSDAFKAAMYDWILHVLTSPVWLSVCPHHVRQKQWATTMTACMTQPGYWSKKLAKELLLEGDDDFQDEWLPIFEASLPETRPDGEGKSGEAAPKNQQVSEPQSDEEMQDAINTAESPAFPAADREAQPRSGSWQKWKGQWQPTPIGLVPS